MMNFDPAELLSYFDLGKVVSLPEVLPNLFGTECTDAI
jgi:hypothetical protein